MKTSTLLFATLILVASVKAQSFARLDINHFNAGFNASGDQLSQLPNFTNPVMTPHHDVSFSVANLWIGGLDAGGQLKIAAQTYRQSGTDFWAGPLDTTSVICTVAQNTFYNKVWKINKTTIDSFRLGLFTTVPASITSWPGNGNHAAGEGQYLAPFVDVDGDGTYSWAAGDYPDIRGDQALFFVYNDHLIGQAHTETGGGFIGLEIRCLAYAVNCADSALSNTVFMHYQIINRATVGLNNTVIGLWTDLDVGGMNNGVGSDSLQNDFYYYNNHSAVGAVFLNQLMARTMTYDNNFSVTGNPTLATEYYGYMNNFFKDGTHLTYGGTGHGGVNNTDYFYTGDPFSTIGWNSGTPADRRMMGMTPSFTFQPGGTYILDMAYVAAYDPSATPNGCVPLLRQRMQAIKTFYSTDITPCGNNITSVPQVQHPENSISAFPNPASSTITIQTSATTEQPYFIYDVAGQLLQTGMTTGSETVLNIAELPVGMYFLRVGKNDLVQTLKFVKSE